MSADRRGVDALALTVERLRQDLERAQETADARALIGIATGILVERGHGGPSEADRYLRRLADTAGLPLLEVAADIVNAASDDGLSEALRPDASERENGPRHAGTALRLRTAESGTRSDDPQTAAEALLRHAVSPLGGTALAVWRAAFDGSLDLVGHAGLTAVEARRWRYVPPGVGTLPQLALTDGRSRWYGSLPDGFPGIGTAAGPVGARAILPARLGGRIMGFLEACWPATRSPLNGAEFRRLETLADLCAHTFTGEDTTTDATVGPLADLADGLLDPSMVLRPLVDDEGRIGEFLITHVNRYFTDLAGGVPLAGKRLLEAFPLAARDGDLYDCLARVHSTGEALRTERMAVAALAGSVPLTVMAAVSISRFGEETLLSLRVEREADRLAALLHHVQRLAQVGGFEENLVTGEISWSRQLFDLHGLPPGSSPVPLRRLPSYVHPDDSVSADRFLRTLMQRHRPASTAFRLRRADGIVRHIRVIAEPVTDGLGALVSVRGAFQDVSTHHWTEVALAATRGQLADAELQAAERNRLALQLQQAIMPPVPAPLDMSGLHVAVRYRPAEKEHLVGGDWYDAVVLPSKEIMVAVGDVAGHGIGAATDMIVLRNALRGLATTGAGPAQLMSWLNSVAHHLTDQISATAVCGLYSPETGVLRWARAGHPAPVLIRDGHASALPLPRGILLGAVAEARYEEQQLTLTSGDRLLLYTDGLVERRGVSVEKSLEQLLVSAGGPTTGLEEHLDQLLLHSRSDTDDDTCLIGIQMS